MPGLGGISHRSRGHRLSCLDIEGTCRGAVVGPDQGEDFGAITVVPPVPGTIEINRMPA
jgi:hypothetical protein